jgi:3-oxoadipate enol-lactonase
MEPVSTTVRVKYGAIRAHRWGDRLEGRECRRAICTPADFAAPLVLCVHGLSANARGFDPMAEALAARGFRVVAIDLRGRGHSTTSPPGTYGWKRHALDVLAVASELTSERFHFVGHSMGAYVGMTACELASEQIASLTLIDAAGFPDPTAMPPILSAVERLGKTHPSVEVYLSRVRSLGTIEPWSAHWERYFHYELEETAAGVHARTSHHAVMEDVLYASTQDPRALWSSIKCRSLLVRAARPLGPPGAFIVPEEDRAWFTRTVRGSSAVDVDANHYGVLMHDDTFDAIGRFLS